MKPMRVVRGLLAALALATCGVGVARQPDTRTVVHYQQPSRFTEARRLRGAGVFDDDAYLRVLKRYLVERADKVLAPGQRLDVTITDLARAGNFEPWLGPDYGRVRIVKAIYPPRIDLRFTLYDANGKVLRHGTRTLTDLAFMDTTNRFDQDPLRYEKALIEDWLRHGPQGL